MGLEPLTPACKGRGQHRLTWPSADERRCGVSVSDRDSPLIAVRSGQGESEVYVRRARQAHHFSEQTQEQAGWPLHVGVRRLESMSPCRTPCHPLGEDLVLRREGCDLVYDLYRPAEPQDVAGSNTGGSPTLKPATPGITTKRYRPVKT
jgi:hypothetical protein